MTRLVLDLLLLLVLPVFSASAVEKGSAAPLFALTLADVDGSPVSLSSFKGKPLMVNFWARWCVPCRKEIPDLAALPSRHRGSGLVVIGIAVEDADKADQLREFGAAYEMSYRSLIGGMQASIELMRALGNQHAGLPFTVVVDRAGHISQSKLGAMTAAEMDDALKALP